MSSSTSNDPIGLRPKPASSGWRGGRPLSGSPADPPYRGEVDRPRHRRAGCADALGDAVPAAIRPPPVAAKLLLPVWGTRYVQQFIDLSLPTLLAPGNIPALAVRLPCELEFLTSSEDVELLRSSPALARLKSTCRVSVRIIDDLIVRSLHSLTITLAYARAIRAMGGAALDTCFFMLVSDYVITDGSLDHVLGIMLGGASAVQAGNFQMIDADWQGTTLPSLADGVLALRPRELVRRALERLHPKTIANMADSPLSHNLDCNRLFWRAGPDALIGRFFLLHPICIRPERTDFVIGSSVDYSFVPEMCSPENVVTVTNSDHYLVVELQPLAHEAESIRLGPATRAELAGRLSGWTTAHHRRNADSTIIYHAGEASAALTEAATAAKTFIADIRRRLSIRPQPHRAHPYWCGAVAAFRGLTGSFPSDLTSRDLQLGFHHAALRGRWVAWRQRLQQWLLEPLSAIGIASPLWPDLREPALLLSAASTGRREEVLAIDVPGELRSWLGRRCGRPVVSHECGPTAVPSEPSPRHGTDAGFDDCLLYVGRDQMGTIHERIEGTMQALRPAARLLVLVINEKFPRHTENFTQRCLEIAPSIERTGLRLIATRFVPASSFRIVARRGVRVVVRLMRRGGPVGKLLAAPLAAVVAPSLLIANLGAAFRSKRPAPPGGVSSMLLIAEAPEGCHARRRDNTVGPSR